jgi:hypothetical protein
MAKKKAANKNQKNNSKKSMGKIFHKKTEIDGIIFDSQTEAEYYEYLKAEKKAGHIKSFTMQDEFVIQEKFLLINGERISSSVKGFSKLQKANPGCTVQAIKYRADFMVHYKDGSVRVIDVKGQKTADFKIKEKMFNYMYPQYNGLYCVVKYNGGWMEYNEAQKLKRERKKKKTK